MRAEGSCNRENSGARAGSGGAHRGPLLKGVRVSAAAAVILASAALFIAGCGGKKGDLRYAAERSLFRARKMREELLGGGIKPEFLEKTLESYRGVVLDYGGAMKETEGLEEIIVTAQMELAEIEFRAGRPAEAVKDFEKAASLAEGVPGARANALYSAAVILNEMNDRDRAADLYARFSGEFLVKDSLLATAGMNSRYLVTPLKIAEIKRMTGDARGAAEWLGEAENSYRYIIENSGDEAIVKEMRFNLLTAYLQGKKWSRSLEAIEELKALYSGEKDRSSLLYLEAKVYEDGLNDSRRALEAFLKVHEEYPVSNEAPLALLAAGAIEFEEGDYDKAVRLFNTIVDGYADAGSAVVEAQWQLARIDEERGKWVDASLRYKMIYTDYPTTPRGLEAPLRIAESYSEKGETDAARAAYQRALEQYENLLASQIPGRTKITLEEYIVRTLAEQKEWKAAADRLLTLPDKYPRYAGFRNGYLMAASIHERELGDPERAAEILSECIEKYPESELAAEAQRQLDRLGGKK